MWSKISNVLKPQDSNDSDSVAQCPPPDPFRVDAATYYTHQTHPTPPSGAHTRTNSREEDIILSLRTQLALQQELCTQFEIDLRARDKLVEALTTRLEASEKDNDKRRNVIRSWKKKAVDLEKMCRHLEVEVESSRYESMERSIMDEATGDALNQLHRRIAQLEREKNAAEAEREALAQTTAQSAQTMRKMEADILRLQEELASVTSAKSEVEQQLQDQVSQLRREKCDVETEQDNFASEASRLRTHIQQLQKDSAAMEVTILQLNKQRDQDKEDIDGLNIALESKQQELELVKRKHGARSAVGLNPGQTNVSVALLTGGKSAKGPPARTSTTDTRTLGSAPSALARATNKPLSGTLHRVSGPSMESKTKTDRRASIAVMPSDTDEKENASSIAPLKNPRRMMIP